jgi:hypothetical protein
MRMIKGFSAAFVAALAASGLSAIAGGLELKNFMMPHRDYRNRGASKRRITGKQYPHSSARQRARYARQIAAGQIHNA